jgi:hypothetical protein
MWTIDKTETGNKKRYRKYKLELNRKSLSLDHRKK